jgi:hypothetical protein
VRLAGLFDFGGGEAEGGAAGGAAGAITDTVAEKTPTGGTPIVHEVQVRLIAAGGKLPKYGPDGKWGSESLAAWGAIVGGPVTRAAVENLVGHSYSGSMAVFGVSDSGAPVGGGGTTGTTGGEATDPAKVVEPPSDVAKYAGPVAGILGAGLLAYLGARWYRQSRKGRS